MVICDAFNESVAVSQPEFSFDWMSRLWLELGPSKFLKGGLCRA